MIKILLLNLIISSGFSAGFNQLLINKWISTLDEFNSYAKKNYCVEFNSRSPIMNTEIDQVVETVKTNSKDQAILKKCLAKKRKTSKKSVKYNSYHYCSANMVMSDNVSYDIAIEKGNPDFFKISLNVLLTTNERKKVLERTKSAKVCVQQIYANQGLYLDLNFYTSEDLLTNRSSIKIHHTVNVYAFYPEMDSRNWSVSVTPSGEVTDERLCVVIAHELGHTLGLADSYHDPRCNLRRLSKNVNAFMNVLGESNQVRLEESEIAKIIEPLCQVQL